MRNDYAQLKEDVRFEVSTLSIKQLSSLLPLLRAIPREHQYVEHEARDAGLDCEGDDNLGLTNRQVFVRHIAMLQARLDEANNTIARQQRLAFAS